MEKAEAEVAVVGGGIAGAAITWELAQRGVDVAVIDRSDGVASTFGNQRWQQVGTLARDEHASRVMWASYQRMPAIARRHIHSRGADFLAVEAEMLARRKHEWDAWGIATRRLSPQETQYGWPLGTPACAGGYRGEDGVIDFPALVEDLLAEACRRGARLVRQAEVTGPERDADGITGVRYSVGRAERLMRCDTCILAAGAWALERLDALGVTLPVTNYKSHVVVVRGELVPRITAFLDGPLTTLVPYRGTTLIANADRVAANSGWDRAQESAAVEAILDGLHACFPRLRRGGVEVVGARGCIKTEPAGMGSRAQSYAVFGPGAHGVGGLLAVFPGKASLAFSLARYVADSLVPVEAVVGSSQAAMVA